MTIGPHRPPHRFPAVPPVTPSACPVAEARDNYLTSSQLFQQARGFRGPNGGTTDRLDGASSTGRKQDQALGSTWTPSLCSCSPLDPSVRPQALVR